MFIGAKVEPRGGGVKAGGGRWWVKVGRSFWQHFLCGIEGLFNIDRTRVWGLTFPWSLQGWWLQLKIKKILHDKFWIYSCENFQITPDKCMEILRYRKGDLKFYLYLIENAMLLRLHKAELWKGMDNFLYNGQPFKKLTGQDIGATITNFRTDYVDGYQ